jgi:hypothetical protein
MSGIRSFQYRNEKNADAGKRGAHSGARMLMYSTDMPNGGLTILAAFRLDAECPALILRKTSHPCFIILGKSFYIADKK